MNNKINFERVRFCRKKIEKILRKFSLRILFFLMSCFAFDLENICCIEITVTVYRKNFYSIERANKFLKNAFKNVARLTDQKTEAIIFIMLTKCQLSLSMSTSDTRFNDTNKYFIDSVIDGSSILLE